jgi:hypothetical protein
MTPHLRTADSPRSLVAPATALAGWVAFAWYLIAQARAGPVIIWNDSRAYAEVASKPLWSTGFWQGRRPPLTPLVIKVFGSSGGLLVAQGAVAAVAWGVLGWTVGRLVPPGWRRVLAIWVILAFATALPVAMWNRSLLSESMSMSALALLFAGFIWTARRITWPRIAATTAACLCFAATRDSQVWTVVVLGVIAGIYALTQVRKSRAVSIRAGGLAVCLLVVGIVPEWGTLASHRTTQDVADIFYVRVLPFPDRVAWFAAHGMPERQQIDKLAATAPSQRDVARVVAFPPDDPAFKPLERWIVDHGASAYLLWLATHPWYVVSEPLQRPERSYNFGHGDLTIYAPAVHRMESPLTSLMWPSLLAFLLMSALAIFLATLTEVWTERPWRVVTVLTLVGIVAMLIAWHGDGQEVTRHTVEGAAEVRLGVWILVTLGLIGLTDVDRRRTGDDARRVGRRENRIEETIASRTHDCPQAAPTAVSPTHQELSQRQPSPEGWVGGTGGSAAPGVETAG